MKGLFSPDNKFGRMILKAGYFIILSWLWVLTSLPIFTIGASSVALYDIVRKVLKDKEGPISRTFFQSFRANFKQATGLWLIVLAVLLVFIYCAGLYSFMGDESTLGKVIFWIFVVIVVCFAAWAQIAFSYIARIADTVKTTMRNVLLMCIMHPLTVLRVGGQAALVATALVVLPLAPVLPMIISLVPACYCAFLVPPVEKLFGEYIPQEENKEENAQSMR